MANIPEALNKIIDSRRPMVMPSLAIDKLPNGKKIRALIERIWEENHKIVLTSPGYAMLEMGHCEKVPEWWRKYKHNMAINVMLIEESDLPADIRLLRSRYRDTILPIVHNIIINKVPIAANIIPLRMVCGPNYTEIARRVLIHITEIAPPPASETHDFCTIIGTNSEIEEKLEEFLD